MNEPSFSFDKTKTGAAVIDGKTPISFFVGFVAGAAGLNPSWAAVTVIGFEAFLVMLEDGLGAAFEKRSPQSYGNQLVDAMMGIAGAYAGEHMKRQQEAGTLYQEVPVVSSGISPTLIAASNGAQEPLTGLNRVRWVR